ncbi:hypothetical protein MOUN0_J09274 [Monosporozyma unispora]|nr:hypothetical protein C6P44_003901 [Kazachstania unispora]
MPTLWVDEVTAPCSIVSILPRTLDRGFYIVEPIGIRKWSEYSSNSDQKILPLQRTLGYNVAGLYYYSLVVHKEFLFLLKNDGTIQLLNEDLEVVDSLKTGVIPTLNTEFTFKYDDIINQLYINLTKDTIYGIEMKISQDNLHFIHKKQGSVYIIHQFSSTIIDFGTSFHFNEYMNEEFQTIATLLKDDSYNNIFAKIIYKVNPRKTKIDRKWDVLLPNLSLITIKVDYTPGSCLIETITNIGFVVITSHGFLFLTLPHGPQNFINNFIISDMLDERDSFKNETVFDNANQQCKLYPVSSRKKFTERVVTFDIITGDNKHAVITFTKEREEDEKYIIYWRKDLKLSEVSDNEFGNWKNTNYCTFINSTTLDYLQVTNVGRLYVKSFNNKIKSTQLNIEQSNIIYASLTSNIMNDYVTTGFNSSQETCLFTINNTFSDYFIYKEFESKDIKNIPDNTVLDSANLSQVRIRNLKVEATCELTRDLVIKWSNTDETFTLSNHIKTSSLALDSTTTLNGNNVTLLGINNEVIFIENYMAESRKIKLQESVKINSLFLQEYKKNGSIFKNIWVSDLNGLLWIIDFTTAKIKDTIRLHHKVLKFCDSMSLCSSYIGPIIYGRDCLILSRVNEHSDNLELLSLSSIPFSFQILLPNYQSNKIEAYGENHFELTFKQDIIINNKLKRVTLQDHLMVIKYVRLSSCSPYLICVAINPVLKISYLKLFSIHEERFIHSIDLSESYTQAIVTDIAVVPYIESKSTKLNFEKEHNDELHYAEKLILDQCFIVSLNYEISEYDDHDNILLYSLDEELGQIIFQNGIKTNSSITCLSNFENNFFIASGDTLELFKINYSVKWNSFLMKLISNKLELNGLIKNVVILEGEVGNFKLLLLDLFRGFRDIDLSLNLENDKELRYDLEYVTSAEEHPIVSDTNQCEIISNFESVEINGNRWFILGLNSNKLKLYHYDSSDEEYESTEFVLPNEILNITSVDDKRYEYWQNEDQDRILLSQNILFVITTKNGGAYNIRQTERSVKLSRTKKNILKQQLSFIAGNEEEGEEEATDNEEMEEDEIKIIDSKIISEYSFKL